MGGVNRLAVASLIVLALALSGCVTDAERAAQAASDDKDCRSYGAQPGTSEYYQCRMAKSERRDVINSIEEEQQRQASERLIEVGTSLMANGH